MRPVALNVFQKTQRDWDRLHPYNAAQLMGLTNAPAPEVIAAAFRSALADLRLGVFRLEGEVFTVDAADAPFELLHDDDLHAFLSREMNRPFAADRTMPFRPFLARDDGGVVVGIVYQHWVADSVAIRMLMRQWLLRLTGSGEAAPVRFERGTLQRRFGPAAAGWSVVVQLVELVGFTRAMRRMRRVHRARPSMAVCVTTRRAPAGLIHRVAARAKADGYTVGDAFLAATALACDALAPSVYQKHRRNLALGTIVDLRSRAPAMPANVFGLYLGFMMSLFNASELRTFAAACRAARRLRLLQVRRRSAEASQLRIGIGLLIARRLTPDALRNFYRKRFPLSGGLSNVNLTHDPISTASGLLRSYWRVSPTGPLLPLVFTPTTLRDELTICCTWQSALMSEDEAEAIVTKFIDCLEAYAAAADQVSSAEDVA